MAEQPNDRQQHEDPLDLWRRYRVFRPLEQPPQLSEHEWREAQLRRNNPYYAPNRLVRFVAR